MRLVHGGIAAIALAFVVAVPAAAPAVCTGDCDGSISVTVDEIVVGLNIALGTLPPAQCTAFDADGSGSVTVDEIVTAVSNGLDGCPPELPTPIFPANYRDTYTEVRDCRFSIEHGGVTIRVFANDVGAQPYLDDANPLPVGSIIVKEEFAGSTCDDEDFVRWRPMRKEAPGFDPEDGDWHWQWVEPDRTVTFDDKSTCIGCHVRPECLARDYMCTVGDEVDTKLDVVLDDLPAALLSISGNGPTDMYAVGGDPDDGFGPLVLHYDGNVWRRLNTRATGDLWWISVEPIDGDFYMVGSGGLVLRYDPVAKTFAKLPTPGDETLFGVWGTSAENLWVVGGDTNNPEFGGVLWRYNGSTWSVYDTTQIRSNGVPNLFKVWGRSAGELYAVGNRGVFLRYDGDSWSELNTGSVRPLFTVHGNDTLVVASGGFVDGVVIEFDGTAFAQRAQPGVVQMNGVFLAEDGAGVAAGITGGISRRGETGWEVTDDGLDTLFDFHAVFVDPEGGTWAVGGDLSVALEKGMLAYAGPRLINSAIVDLPKCPPGQFNPEATVSYTNDVLPIFVREGCLSPVCHGGGLPAGGYDMRQYETIFGQGTAARVFGLCDVVPGDPDSSFLIEKLGPSPRFGRQMPDLLPPLEADDMQLLRTWILEGAGDDRPATPTPTVTTSPPRTPTPTRSESRTPGAPTATPTPLPSLNPLCDQAGRICTIAGTGLAQFDGDGRDARATSLYFPIDLLFQEDGHLLILDWNNLRLRRLESNGTISTIMGKDVEDFPTNGALAKDTPLHHASDVEYDAEGNLYIAGDHVPVVFRVNTNDRVFTIAGTEDYGYDGDGGSALAAKLQTPFGVLPKPGGGFYIADVDAHVVRLVDAGGVIDTVAGTGERGYSGDDGPATAARLAGPSRMALDAGGNLYICETKNHVVRRLAPDGTITTAFGTGERGYDGDGGPAAAALLDAPYGVTIAPNGDFYIADTGNNVVRRVNGAGVISTVVGIGIAGFGGDTGPGGDALLNRPSAIAFDDSGAMWIADTSNHRVRRVAGFLGLQQ
jgi:hypothetical protein